VGVLRTIVQALVLAVLHARKELAFRCSVAGQLVGGDHPWHVVQAFEQFAEELLGSVLVASALHQDIQYIAILINGPPQRVPLPIDCEKDLIQMPFVSWSRTSAFQFIGGGANGRNVWLLLQKSLAAFVPKRGEFY
jgi:hypothetical protein